MHGCLIFLHLQLLTAGATTTFDVESPHLTSEIEESVPTQSLLLPGVRLLNGGIGMMGAVSLMLSHHLENGDALSPAGPALFAAHFGLELATESPLLARILQDSPCSSGALIGGAEASGNCVGIVGLSMLASHTAQATAGWLTLSGILLKAIKSLYYRPIPVEQTLRAIPDRLRSLLRVALNGYMIPAGTVLLAVGIQQASPETVLIGVDLIGSAALLSNLEGVLTQISVLRNRMARSETSDQSFQGYPTPWPNGQSPEQNQSREESQIEALAENPRQVEP